MAAKGASLQNYNHELVRCISDLREKREEVNRSLLRDEVRGAAARAAARRARRGGRCTRRRRVAQVARGR